MSASGISPVNVRAPPSIPAIQPVASPNIKIPSPTPIAAPRTAVGPTLKPPGLPPTSPRQTKTPFLSHPAQTAAGGAKPPQLPPPLGNRPAIPPPTPPGVPRIPPGTPRPGLPGGAPPPLPGFIPRQQRPPGFFQQHFPQRPFMQDPSRFTQFDHRFDDDRVRNNAFIFREEFDDDDRIRFFPFIQQQNCGQLQLIQHILGFAFADNIETTGRDQPDGCGVWELGSDGLWYNVSDCSRGIIDQIEMQRTFGHHAPQAVVIPC